MKIIKHRKFIQCMISAVTAVLILSSFNWTAVSTINEAERNSSTTVQADEEPLNENAENSLEKSVYYTLLKDESIEDFEVPDGEEAAKPKENISGDENPANPSDPNEEKKEENSEAADDSTTEQTTKAKEPKVDESVKQVEQEKSEKQKDHYDPQPESKKEVQAAIDQYEQSYERALQKSGRQAAFAVAKPHWEFEVHEDLMPDGYECISVSVEEDTVLDAPYFTFLSGIKPAGSGIFGFDSGSAYLPGSPENPYLIEDSADLQKLAEFVRNRSIDGNGASYHELCYKLTNDLDLSGISIWTPIGIYTDFTSMGVNTNITTSARSNFRKPFSGNFDGDGHTIYGLKTGWPAANAAAIGYTHGLFGLVDGAEIKNITIDGANHNGAGAAGILVGYSLGDTKIDNCHVSGTMTPSLTYYGGMGGLVGYFTVEKSDITPSIINCSVNGTITGNAQNTGGLIGYIRSGNETYSNNGRANWQSSLTIRDCSVEAEVKSTAANTGGLVGQIDTENSNEFSIVIEQCSMEGSVTSNRAYTAGMTGLVNSLSSDDFSLSFLDCSINTVQIGVSAQIGVGGLAGTVNIRNGNKNLITVKRCGVTGNDMLGGYHVGGLFGDIALEKPYTVADQTVAQGGHTVLIEDSIVGISRIMPSSNRAGGVIGRFDNKRFDDVSLIISNCQVNTEALTAAVTSSSYDIGGIIGIYNVEGLATNYMYEDDYTDTTNQRPQRSQLNVNDCTVTTDITTAVISGYNVGGIAGSLNMVYAPEAEVSIRGCKMYGMVSTTGNSSYNVGGIVGRLESAACSYSKFEIADCSTYGNVSTSGISSNYVGGILGFYNSNGQAQNNRALGANREVQFTLTECSVFAENITSSGYYVGGILGHGNLNRWSYQCDILIEDCISKADIKSSSYYIGGLIGYLENSRKENMSVRQSIASAEVNPNADVNAELASYITVRNCSATGSVIGTGVSGAGSNVGGFVGHIHAGDDNPHDAILIENCYATGTVEISDSAGLNAGGFVGRPSKNVTIRNCYATGDVFSQGIHTGGFAGYVEGDSVDDDRVVIENCYSTGNATANNGYSALSKHSTGGFVGRSQYAFIANCYSTGSVYNNNNYNSYEYGIGGFAGTIATGGRFTNCFAAGHVDDTDSADQNGGFYGFRWDVNPSFPLYIIDCFYDTTTTQQTAGIGGRKPGYAEYDIITQNGTAISDVPGYTTSEIIDFATYQDVLPGWNMKNNISAVAAFSHTGTANNPWYIDHNTTYPYLFHQADGFNEDLFSRTNKPDIADPDSAGDGKLVDITVNSAARNYFMATLENTTVAGGPYTSVSAKRADYHSDVLAGLSIQYRAATAGAARAFFPYVHGKTVSDHDDYQFWFNSDGQVTVPKASTYQHKADTVYSFGSVSQTNIIAFAGGPYVSKTSDRPVWVNGDKKSYTYVGQFFTYSITVGNYSTEGRWDNVVITDPLPAGVNLRKEKVFIDYGDGPIQVSLWDGEGNPPAIPYYTCMTGRTWLAGRDIVSIHIGDFGPAMLNGDTLEAETCVITFETQIGHDSATDFLPDGSWEGDNIRNRGLATGEFTNLIDDTTETISLLVDDRNTDPVYDSNLVFYNSNYDLDYISEPSDIELLKGYYLKDGSENHHVLPNEDPHDGTDYLDFSLEHYDFEGWFYYDDDESMTRIQVQPGDDITHIDRDIILYSNWVSTDETFEFYKVDSQDRSLAGAVFELYQWTGTGDPSSQEKVTGQTIADGKWEKVSTHTSADDDIPISLSFSQTGFYQLVEADTPSGYHRPGQQWRFEAIIEQDNTHVTPPIHIISKEYTSNIIFNETSQRWMLKNYTSIPFDFIKISQSYLHMDGSYAEPLTGAEFTLYVWDADREPGDDELVTEDGIANGDWKEHETAGTNGQGKVSFHLIDDKSIYQLVETKAPDYFQRPEGQWRLTIAPGKTLADVIRDIRAIPGLDGKTPPAFKTLGPGDLDGSFDGQLALTNLKEYELPDMGAKGIYSYLFAGLFVFCIGLLIAGRKGRNK